MNKEVIKAARKFRRKVKGKPNVKNVAEEIEAFGYDIIRLNTKRGAKFAKNIGITDDKLLNGTGFTFCGDVRVVFVNFDRPYADRLHTLLHELGHITLGHLGTGWLKWFDAETAEKEAETFACEVLRKHKNVFVILHDKIIGFINSYQEGALTA